MKQLVIGLSIVAVMVNIGIALGIYYGTNGLLANIPLALLLYPSYRKVVPK